MSGSVEMTGPLIVDQVGLVGSRRLAHAENMQVMIFRGVIEPDDSDALTAFLTERLPGAEQDSETFEEIGGATFAHITVPATAEGGDPDAVLAALQECEVLDDVQLFDAPAPAACSYCAMDHPSGTECPDSSD